jgi:hypothetical protein
MEIYRGKAKDLTYKRLLYIVYWELARPIERLEPTDFCLN